MNKIIYLFFISIIISSCAVRKTIEIDYTKAPKNTKQLISRVNTKHKSPEWIAIKGKISIVKQDNKFDLNLNIKARKDSIVWVSVSAPFGIELFRAMLTKDSIYYLNRTNKTYFVKSNLRMNELLKTDISFNQIEQMIMATVRVVKQEYEFKEANDMYMLESKDVTYNINSKTYKVIAAELHNAVGEIEFSFSNFENQMSYLYPRQLKVKVTAKKDYEAILNYSKVIMNKQQKFSFKIPSSYDEI